MSMSAFSAAKMSSDSSRISGRPRTSSATASASAASARMYCTWRSAMPDRAEVVRDGQCKSELQGSCGWRMIAQARSTLRRLQAHVSESQLKKWLSHQECSSKCMRHKHRGSERRPPAVKPCHRPSSTETLFRWLYEALSVLLTSMTLYRQVHGLVKRLAQQTIYSGKQQD